MDSTPTSPQRQPEGPPLVSIKSSPRKLPIKRKNLLSSSDPNPNFLSSKLQSTLDQSDAVAKPPPFKFHRIWTEPDEIRFLQGLLDCASRGLSFPRDLQVFHDRFSGTMSQPYAKSQLSEKLRRLRKKFRVISSRLAGGLSPSVLSQHDRALYELSEKLWSPELSSSSTFGNNSNDYGSNEKKKKKKKKSEGSLVGVRVSFSPALANLSSHSNQNLRFQEIDGDVNVEYEGSESGGLGGVAAKVALDVFDECLEEVRNRMVVVYLNNKSSKVLRWHRQRVAELEVLARRLRLVLDNSLHAQSLFSNSM
ncbi:probable transcription factor At5g28040 [Corylus avellana]|uniref:probable transcription factor At5g28040 n=1 Tax=Corylus avellana TaxID=13451 RepID=UPI001E233BCA|nr:probable transcription factor At5g28040 [Corylus avellana]